MRRKGGGRGSRNQQEGGAGTERRHSYNDRNRNTSITNGQADGHRRGQGCRPSGKKKKKQRKQSSEMRGERACCGHVKMCTVTNEDFFFL